MYASFDKINEECITNQKQTRSTQDVQWFSTTAYIHSQKLTTEPNNFIKIDTIIIKAKIIKESSQLAKQASSGVFGGYGL